MWFQYDEAPAHFSADMRSALDTAYRGRWIGRGGPVNCPARSPCLSCIDIFLWGRIKSLVYASPSLVYGHRRCPGCEDCRRSSGERLVRSKYASPRRNEEKFQQFMEFQQGTIIGLRKGEFSYNAIGARVLRNSSTVMQAWKQWTDKHRIARKTDSGRRKVTSVRD
ncbi:uncharacterized protein TNCV_3277521 [Trichonephila clavipes]|nr:uncharacterized protein TNCV_3277521 [Trichonephila clavipes]